MRLNSTPGKISSGAKMLTKMRPRDNGIGYYELPTNTENDTFVERGEVLSFNYSPSKAFVDRCPCKWPLFPITQSAAYSGTHRRKTFPDGRILAIENAVSPECARRYFSGCSDRTMERLDVWFKIPPDEFETAIEQCEDIGTLIYFDWCFAFGDAKPLADLARRFDIGIVAMTPGRHLRNADRYSILTDNCAIPSGVGDHEIASQGNFRPVTYPIVFSLATELGVDLGSSTSAKVG